VSHVFWRRKEQFQLPCDTYSEWVLFAVTEGRFRYRIEEASGEARFGDIVLCPPQAAFHREVLEPVSFHFYTFRWEAVSQIGDGETSGPPRPVGGMKVRDNGRLSSTYHYLQQLNNVPEEQRLASVQLLFRDVWHLIALESALAETRSSDSVRADPDMEEAARWIRQHAFEPVLMKDFSEAKAISQVQLTRRFQAAWGQTPIDYLTSLRIQQAKTLLLETRLPLDEIAVRCGYENGFYLSRVFTKRVKLNPSQFRRMNRL
jgi:AraC-like DNA-binding protein